MVVFVLGLILFLGIHSVRMVAGNWRDSQVARLGIGPWKGLYSVVSLLGFVLLVWGYGLAHRTSIVIWSPPSHMRDVTALFTLVAFVFLAGAYIPGNWVKARLGHPMLLGVQLWAIGHLLANGSFVDIVLFGAFLVWAVAAFLSDRRRDSLRGATYPAATMRGNTLTLIAGVLAWALFAFFLHGILIGVRPFA